MKRLVLACVIVAITIGSLVYVSQKHPFSTLTTTSHISTETPFSEKQVSQHKILWQGYINARKEIAEKLQTVDRATAKSRSYSAYRSLKLAETYAYNGDILHRLYFENISNNSTVPGAATSKLITASFGTFEAFQTDFMACGQSARGWVMTAYSLDDHKLYNFLLEEHNQSVPIMTIPLLILDVYEHAYMIDFGIDRTTYLNLFWNHINWDIVEQRYTALERPLIEASAG